MRLLGTDNTGDHAHGCHSVLRHRLDNEKKICANNNESWLEVDKFTGTIKGLLKASFLAHPVHIMPDILACDNTTRCTGIFSLKGRLLLQGLLAWGLMYMYACL